MLFSSITFLFIFLPIVFLLYYSVKKDYRNYILLIASIIFYGFANIKYLGLLFGVIFVNYFGAIVIDQVKNKFAENKIFAKLLLFIIVIANISVLVYFKYFNFFIDNINSITKSHFAILNIILPIGISFYIFQALSYIFDVYRGICKIQKNFSSFALYVCLFPQLVAGPIIKYHDIESQLRTREEDFDNINLGVKRFIMGLAKKIIIADTFGVLVDKIFMQDPNNFSNGVAWLGSIAYTFQIYYDFSGYSDMAIGLGLIFGFKFMENFNYPYISKSITEFWRRWHISLSTWFKNYLYIPLGGNKCGKIRTSINLLIVFFITGLWHGANWTFVAWGMWNGFFIVLEKWFNIKEFDSKPHTFLLNSIRQTICFVICCVGFVFFRSKDIAYAFKYLKNMFFMAEPCQENYLYMPEFYMQRYEYIIFVLAVLFAFPVLKNIYNSENAWIKVTVNICLLTIFLWSIMALSATTYNPFIYFQF